MTGDLHPMWASLFGDESVKQPSLCRWWICGRQTVWPAWSNQSWGGDLRQQRLTAGDVSAASAREPITDLLIIHPLRGRLPVICLVAPDTNSPRDELHDVGMLWYCEHASVGLMPCRFLSVSLCCRVRLWKRVYWLAWDVCHMDCVLSVCHSVGWCVFLHHVQLRTCPQYFIL